MEEIKLSRNQKNSYHTELCSVSAVGSQHQTTPWDRRARGKERAIFLSKGRKGQWVLQQEDQFFYILSQWKSNQICWKFKKINIAITVIFPSTYGICRGTYLKTSYYLLSHLFMLFSPWPWFISELEKKKKKRHRVGKHFPLLILKSSRSLICICGVNCWGDLQV